MASSDATNIESSIVREGDEFVINGRKWWTSGAMDPRTKVCIFMGKTDTSAARHRQQSMVLLPFDSPGIRGERRLVRVRASSQFSACSVATPQCPRLQGFPTRPRGG